MKGVTIGEGAIIEPNSVVLSNIPPFSVAAGNPARVLQRLSLSSSMHDLKASTDATVDAGRFS